MDRTHRDDGDKTNEYPLHSVFECGDRQRWQRALETTQQRLSTDEHLQYALPHTHQQTRRSPTPHVRNNITHTHAHLTALCPRLHGWVGTRKVKPIWVLLKQETVSGSDISWAVCRSAPRSRQITTPARHNSVFYRPDALPDAQPTVSKHWRHQQEQYQHTLYRLPSGVAA